MRRKYSKALRSLCLTPSPSAYMRPSFHCASGWPFSAAYSSECTAFSVSPALSHCAPLRKASAAVGCALSGGALGMSAGGRSTAVGCAASGAAGASSDLVPSKANAGAAATQAATTSARAMVSDVRIAIRFGSAARMGDGALERVADLLGVFPQIARRVAVLARLPLTLALGEFLGRQLDVERALLGVDLDDVAVADEADRPADRRFRADMADAEAARRAGEAPVGDQRHLLALALAVERRRGRQHLAHTGAAFGALVADHQNLAFLVGALLHRLEAGFLAVEAARRPGEFQRLHAGHFDDRAFGGEIALEADDAAGLEQRLIGRTHDVLVRIPFHVLQVLGDGAAGDGHAVAVQEAVVEQGFHQKRHAACFEHILGDITAARFQIRDIRCLFEDFGDVEQ